mmetsp:Transcript_16267/g.35602  ORF Transcript_16267/g.35602 Transcript_16267/m.35602 type:complete len:329 (-) Transcript_16267:209-1195(-)
MAAGASLSHRSSPRSRMSGAIAGARLASASSSRPVGEARLREASDGPKAAPTQAESLAELARTRQELLSQEIAVARATVEGLREGCSKLRSAVPDLTQQAAALRDCIAARKLAILQVSCEESKLRANLQEAPDSSRAEESVFSRTPSGRRRERIVALAARRDALRSELAKAQELARSEQAEERARAKAMEAQRAQQASLLETQSPQSARVVADPSLIERPPAESASATIQLQIHNIVRLQCKLQELASIIAATCEGTLHGERERAKLSATITAALSLKELISGITVATPSQRLEALAGLGERVEAMLAGAKKANAVVAGRRGTPALKS